MSKGKITLALTGSFGSGKSAALEYFAKLGAETVSCDKIAKELTSGRDRKLEALLVQTFGTRILAKSGGLDRRAMAAVVFSDSRARKKLEALLHPRIMARVQERLKRSRKSVRVVEVPLLFEAGLQDLYDAVIAVRAPQQQIFKRLKRFGWNRRDIRLRMRSQLPAALKCRKADFILDNNGSRQKLYNQTSKLYQACLSVIEGVQS